jgi:hypothetical protein
MSHLHLFVIPAWFEDLFMAATILAAFLKGGWRERIVALVWAFPDDLLPNLIRRYVCESYCYYGSPPLGPWIALTSDLVMLAVCVWLARRADRYWIIWAGAFALLSVLTDMLAILLPGLVTVWAYMSAGEAWFLLIGAATLWGSLGRRRTEFKAQPAPT